MDMKEIFGTNQAIEGTRQIALKRTAEGKKLGINWALTLVIGFIVLMGATVASVIPALGLLIADAALSGEEVIITLSDLNTENSAFVLGSLWGEGFIIVAFLIYARINEMRKPATLGFKKKGFLLQYLIGAIAGIGSFSLALLINYVRVFGRLDPAGYGRRSDMQRLPPDVAFEEIFGYVRRYRK